MFALIRVSGKQYRVENGSQLLVDRLAVEEGQAFEGAEVLLVSDGDNVQIGTPVVSGATIDATVVRHTKGKKIRVFKYKAKKNYRRRIGFRQGRSAYRGPPSRSMRLRSSLRERRTAAERSRARFSDGFS